MDGMDLIDWLFEWLVGWLSADRLTDSLTDPEPLPIQSDSVPL